MSPEKFYKLTLASARDGLRKKEFSATELTEAAFAAIEKSRWLKSAFITETKDHALQQAEDKR